MENLADILKRLATTRNVSNGDPPASEWEESDERPDQCEVCGGRGWFTPNVGAGHPEFGQVITCRCQEARLEEERSARLLKYSNLGHLTRFTFETLKPHGQSEDPENQRLFNQAYRAAVEYAENPSGWLVLTGPNGSGKTHLAAAVANHCIAKGLPAFFVHVPDLLDHLRSSFGPASEVSYSDLFEQVKNTPLLVLDGLANQRTTPWAEEKLQQIVNHRSSGQLATVVTTASELTELDPYVRSRLEARDTSRVFEVQVRQRGTVPRLGRIGPEMLRRMTFATFDVRGNNPSASQQASLEAAFQAAKNYADDPHGWLTLFGDTGVGKTHLAVAIAAEQASHGNPVLFTFVPELLDHLRNTFSPESRVTYDRVFDEIKNTPLLIMDDLGREHSNPWAQEKLYQIIVHRHNSRMPTVITSMLEFTEQTGPISSRVRDPYVGQLVRINAPDYRIKEKVGQGRDGRTRRKRAAR